MIERIDRITSHHLPTPEQIESIEEIRAHARTFMYAINALCPSGRMQSVAMTQAEDSLMWAVKAIVLS